MLDQREPLRLELRLLLTGAKVLTTQENEATMREILDEGIDWTIFAQTAIDRGFCRRQLLLLGPQRREDFT